MIEFLKGKEVEFYLEVYYIQSLRFEVGYGERKLDEILADYGAKFEELPVRIQELLEDVR